MRLRVVNLMWPAIAVGCERAKAPVEPTEPTPSAAAITIQSPVSTALNLEPDTLVAVRGTAVAPDPIQRISYRFAKAWSRSRILFDDSTSRATHVDFAAHVPAPLGEDTLIIIAQRQRFVLTTQTIYGTDSTVGYAIADTARVVTRVRRRIALSLKQPVSDTLAQRGFGVVVNIDPTNLTASPELTLDPGTPAQQSVKNFTLGAPYGGGTALGGGDYLLEVLDTLTRGPHRFVVRTYDQFGLRPDSIAGAFVAKIDEVAYHVIPLPGLGGDDADAVRLNDAGTVVGWVHAPDSTSHAAVWRDGVLKTLTPDNAVAAWDVNRKEQIVGCTHIENQPTYAQSAVLWSGDVPQLLAQPCYGYGPPRMNDSGTIAFSSQPTAATIRSPDGTTRQIPVGTIGAINNGGEVVGSASSYNGTNHGQPYAASWPITLGEQGRHGVYYYVVSAFTGINDADQAIGYHREAATELFLSSPSGVRDLTWDFGTATRPASMIAINSRGVVLAFDSPSHAILLWNGKTTIVKLDDPSWQIDRVSGFNANAWITAHGKDPVTGKGAALLLIPKQ